MLFRSKMHPSCGGAFFTLCKVTRRSRVILTFAIRRPMQHLNLLRVMIAGFLLFCCVSCSPDSSKSRIVGTWKGTDEYGHEHFFEFNQDGTLTWWDMDRSMENGSFTKRGPFRGYYRCERNGRLTLTDGFQSLGILTGGGNELQQDDSGHAMRRRLIYKRVDPN